MMEQESREVEWIEEKDSFKDNKDSAGTWLEETWEEFLSLVITV